MYSIFICICIVAWQAIEKRFLSQIQLYTLSLVARQAVEKKILVLDTVIYTSVFCKTSFIRLVSLLTPEPILEVSFCH